MYPEGSVLEPQRGGCMKAQGIALGSDNRIAKCFGSPNGAALMFAAILPFGWHVQIEPPPLGLTRGGGV
ncbi:hypothetical protein CA85_15570 [Allorhodopirellula solitaria]|uniref:Uncharacterized protein n=1 Tax=Allorhodopirellula solitaria TaxID=2527987 RepID=A0A5C5YCI3_9BACT|nr:hypothetical protein CA85_15570 [Allorhodopirellula solitaria]